MLQSTKFLLLSYVAKEAPPGEARSPCGGASLPCSGYSSSGLMMSREPSGRRNASCAPQIVAALARSFADQLSRRSLLFMACGVVMPNAAAKAVCSVLVSSNRALILEDVVILNRSFLPQGYDLPGQKSTTKRN
nr:MAG TPA: hypothetical protein [Caudoviricetes sp.]